MSVMAQQKSKESKEFIHKDGIVARPISFEEYLQLCDKFEDMIFGKYFSLDRSKALSDEERTAVKRLEANEQSLQKFCYGIYKYDQPIGWHYAQQLPSGDLLMKDTAVLPAYQNQGIYRWFLPHLLNEFKESGYQRVISHHRATANQVIIPKLRAGFIIQGVQMDDGMSVILTYYFNEVRREACKVRSGQERPTGRVAEALGFPTL